MRMSTIRAGTQMRGRHFLALFNAGYFHKNNCMVVAQFSTKMTWIRPMPALKFGRMAASSLNGQQLRCFYQQQNSDEQLVAEFHNATTKSAPTMQEMKTTDEDHGTLQFQFRHFHWPNEQFKLSIKFKKGSSGRKFLEFTKHISSKFHSFPHVHVPEDIFGFVQAMDELLGVLEAKKNKIKGNVNKNLKSYSAANKAHLHTVQTKGLNYDYRLKLVSHNRIVEVQLQSLPNPASRKHQPKRMVLPLPAFHWLRHTIGAMFAANGEEQLQLQLGEPPALPAWIRLDIPARVLSPNTSRIPLQQQQQTLIVKAAQPQYVMMNSSAEGVDGHQILVQKWIPLDQHGQQKLNVQYKMGQSGRKYIQIFHRFNSPTDGNFFTNFPKILVPEEIFAFVRAMDEVLNTVHANRDKIEDLATGYQFYKYKLQSEHLMLRKVRGIFYNFELVLFISKRGQVGVTMRTVPNQARPEHQSKRTHLPLWHFHWLRHWIGEMLEENGIKLGNTPHYPEWLNSDSMPNALFPAENHQILPRQQQSRTNISQPPQEWQPQQRRVPTVVQQQQYSMRRQPPAEQLAPAPGRTTMEMERLHQLVQQQQKQLKQIQTAMGRMVSERQRELKNNEQMTELINLLQHNLQSNRNSKDE